MMFLYDKARDNHGFVVGTDNYTEKLLGFSTIGGDALADYMPIQYFWKTEVYGLAKYLVEKYKNEKNEIAINALLQSINLTPQDGLGISTSDMDQIGARNYYDVDIILYAYENSNVDYETFVLTDTYEELCNMLTKVVVDKVLERRINNFKLKLPIEFKF
jgi:NH3-dependent NAD+ synthetase